MKPVRMDQQERATLRELWNEGLTQEAIAAVLGRPRGTISSTGSRMGLPRRKPGRPPKVSAVERFFPGVTGIQEGANG